MLRNTTGIQAAAIVLRLGVVIHARERRADGIRNALFELAVAGVGYASQAASGIRTE